MTKYLRVFCASFALFFCVSWVVSGLALAFFWGVDSFIFGDGLATLGLGDKVIFIVVSGSTMWASAMTMVYWINERRHSVIVQEGKE